MTTITTNKAFLILGFAVLASCKSFDIKPGSERIRVFESEPKGCIFLGEIPAEQEDTVTGATPREIEMSLPTRVEMRNKAYALNANVIVFLSKNKKASSAAPAPVEAPPKKAATTPEAPAAGKAEAVTPAAAPTPSPSAVTDNDSERKVNTVFLATVFRCPPNIVNQ